MIAQTIIHLGVDLQNVTTKATMADALVLALKTMGMVISRGKNQGRGRLAANREN